MASARSGSKSLSAPPSVSSTRSTTRLQLEEEGGARFDPLKTRGPGFVLPIEINDATCDRKDVEEDFVDPDESDDEEEDGG